jgi:hypothetical protein
MQAITQTTTQPRPRQTPRTVRHDGGAADTGGARIPRAMLWVPLTGSLLLSGGVALWLFS